MCGSLSVILNRSYATPIFNLMLTDLCHNIPNHIFGDQVSTSYNSTEVFLTER